ncbi:T-cell-specific guanine nucleotide triphosphate-binding protein 2-like [Mercenaria mercenaria]|uniref:T-cell-specific guanine nucleotide triphosphate-binding protein 2-like n=1 Tax=Mercenaria mercenaria TaxID=6596 RepID=UPI00234F8AAC|nr:T-cell-specific guanine nucleotide triphosphate-binding protein 2-like [Mercenaria mercenaria]XP_053392359.1 T-cell-specific guanine nucleotide triphosphate-binding protein 2-like [Mercenaria mercenaria]XP_053392361.1 T-cell-specific guanine nucleotide triphosphate-binding protein 2-like [Mercenaria mercenaria]
MDDGSTGTPIPFKVTDNIKAKPILLIYHTFEDFMKQCREIFDISTEEEITLESADDGCVVDKGAIPYLDPKSLLILHTTKKSKTNAGHKADWTQNTGESHSLRKTDLSCSGKIPSLDDLADITNKVGNVTTTSCQKTTSDKRETPNRSSFDWATETIEKQTSGAVMIKEFASKHGTINIGEIIKSTVHDWKSEKLAIGVVGQTGSGKSSLINTLRDLNDPENEHYAPVGTTETTSKCKSYPHPKYSNLVFWDIPGVNSTTFPQGTYLRDIDINKYDFFLICSETRFKECDIWLANEIEKLRKHFYFIRTKIDQDLRNTRKQRGANYNKANEMAAIRQECRDKLDGNSPIFLVSSFDPHKFDFPRMVSQLIENAPAEKKRILIMGMVSTSEEHIWRKYSCLKADIWKVAFLSGIVNLVPVPGFSIAIDLPLVYRTAMTYRDAFQLSEADIERYSSLCGVDKSKFTSEAKLSITANFFKMDAFKLFLLALMTVGEATTGMLAFIPLVGSTVCATMSYKFTGNTLQEILDRCKDDAIKIIDFVSTHHIDD